MKANRFILMLLVMLGSVTGAWAQGNVITYKSAQKESERSISQDRNLYGGASIRSHVYDPVTQTGTITFSDNVTELGNNVFHECSFTSITLPPTLTTIRHNAFFGCNNLSSLNIPAGVNHFGDSFGCLCVFNCPNLKSITINSQATLNARSEGYGLRDIFGDQVTEYIFKGDITTIGDIFYLNSLQKVKLPAGVTNIEKFAFYTIKLDTLEVDWMTPIEYYEGAFIDTDVSKTNLLVPCGTTNAYKEKGWGGFKVKENHRYDNSAEPGTPGYYTCTVCEYIDEVRKHVHNYSEEWTITGTHHWHECTSEVGTCTCLKIEEGEHTYDNNAEPGTEAYYKCSVCGYEDLVRQHVHDYSRIYSVSDTQHRYECISEVGTCTVKFIDEAHHYNSSITNDEINYTCDVCGYVNETHKAECEARDYMSMTAKGGDVVLGAALFNEKSPSSYVIQYSQDRVNWTNYPVANDDDIITIQEGKTYYFRSGIPDVLTSVMDKFWNFTMTGSGTIEAGGNVMSLLDRSCQSLTVGEHAFRNLFDNCTLLTVAPEMPATTLGEWCYTEMFNGCTQLQKAPHLPAATLKYECYGGMFSGCSALDYVEADFTEAQPGSNGEAIYKPFQYATDDWLNGTAANGLLVMKREMIEHGFDNGDKLSKPSGWQEALKVKANEDPDHKGNFYTTFYDGKYSFDVIGEAKAYSGSIDGNELRLTAAPDNRIPRYDGVLLHSPSADIVLAIHSNGAERISGNVLTGTDTDTTAPAYCYILSYGQSGLGFYKYATGKAISAHKAYLIKNSSAPLRMVFTEDVPTEIKDVNDNVNENIYSLQGVRLNSLHKGINIVGGKKVMR